MARRGADRVPPFVYLTLPNDHTNGVSPGHPTPQALIADNDLGLGQIVQLVSHSPIWAHSAIFVVEDDSQDGADHVDAHRMPTFVISPYAKASRGCSSRLRPVQRAADDQLMLGLRPLSLFDALATPMYDAFTTRPDLRPYDTVPPQQPLDARNPVVPATPMFATLSTPNSDASRARRLAAALPFDQLDLVPQALSDQMLWHSVYGWSAPPPPPGPGASLDEKARTLIALRGVRERHDIARAVSHALGAPDDDG